MAGSVNKVILVGNVGKDPEIRTTQDGRKIANLRLATSESWKDKASGEKREKTEWHTVVIFNPGLSGVVEAFVSKGTKLYIEGQLQTRKWQDQQGQDRYSTEVVLQAFGGQLHILSGGRGGSESAASDDKGEDARPSNGSASSKPKGGFDKSFDDEIPF